MVHGENHSALGWDAEGEIAILAAGPKGGRVRVKLVTYQAVLDTTIDVTYCNR